MSPILTCPNCLETFFCWWKSSQEWPINQVRKQTNKQTNKFPQGGLAIELRSATIYIYNSLYESYSKALPYLVCPRICCPYDLPHQVTLLMWSRFTDSRKSAERVRLQRSNMGGKSRSDMGNCRVKRLPQRHVWCLTIWRKVLRCVDSTTPIPTALVGWWDIQMTYGDREFHQIPWMDTGFAKSFGLIQVTHLIFGQFGGRSSESTICIQDESWSLSEHGEWWSCTVHDSGTDSAYNHGQVVVEHPVLWKSHGQKSRFLQFHHWN